jgi:hypothetical protein
MQRFRATYARPQLIRKAETSIAGMWRKAILTFPCTDLAGDFVNPSGLNFAEHQRDPSIDLEHGRTPDVRGRPVAWARESLDKPGAPYAVEWKSLNIADDGQPPEYHNLPVGTSYFNPSDRISSQVFALVEQDALPAVSLEFKPVHGFYKSLGKSPLEARDAYRFERADVVRWTLCARGVNPGALNVLKGMGQQVPPLQRILIDRRVKVGGAWEPLCEVIYKALAPAPAKRTTVSTAGLKAMDNQYQQQPTPTDDPLATANENAVDDMQDDAPALGGVSAKYKFAQTIMDACNEYEQDMQSSDSPELRKMAEKFRAMAKQLAGKVKGAADKHDARLSGDPDADMDEDTGEEEDGEGKKSDADADTDDDADMEEDEEGTFKAVRGPYKPILKAVHTANMDKVKRFREADLSTPRPAPQVRKSPPQSEELAATVREFQKWQKHAGAAS